MAVPVLQLSETNGAGATVTDGVPQISFASTDTASTVGLPASAPINQGSNSVEKWNRFKLTVAAPNAIGSFGVYFAATAPTDAGGSSSNVTIKYQVNAAYATPVATTSTVATLNTNADTSAPGTTVTAPANTVGSYTGYITEQLQLNIATQGGNIVFPSPWATLTYVYS